MSHSAGSLSPICPLFSMIEAAISIVESETAAIASDAQSMKPLTERKAQTLAQIDRLLAASGDRPWSEETRGAVKRLRHVLEINRRALEVELRAARAVSQMIVDALEAAASDGTYGAAHFGRQSR